MMLIVVRSTVVVNVFMQIVFTNVVVSTFKQTRRLNTYNKINMFLDRHIWVHCELFIYLFFFSF
jgi:hypothetical protein